jgi:hypothetical protein
MPMKLETSFLKDFFAKKGIGGEISINDLRDKEFSGGMLSMDERKALKNYDTYRIKVLNSQSDEETFHKVYRQLQVVANLGDWKEFLKTEYEN